MNWACLGTSRDESTFTCFYIARFSPLRHSRY